MPFYIRTRPRRPLWLPAVWGGAAMLLWSMTEAFLVRSAGAQPQLGALGRVGYAMGLSVIAGGIVCALYWGLGTPQLRKLAVPRLLAASTVVAIYLALLTVGAGLGKPEGPWFRLGRANFWLSTGLVSLVLGWFVARDPLNLAKDQERVYLTPTEFAALNAPQQALLRLDTANPEAANPTSAG